MLDKLIAGTPSRRQYIAYGLMVAVLLVLPLFLSDFRLALVGKYLAFAVAAVGLDLGWGVVRPRLLLDEEGRARPVPGGASLHLLAPFVWAFETLRELHREASQ